MIKVKTFMVGDLETNCYLVYDQEAKTGFLIDPGFFDESIADFIKENKINVKSIIVTHGHADHTSGNAKFGYPVLIHEADKGYLTNPVKNLSLFTGKLSTAPKASRILKDGEVIEDGKIKIEVIHTPGHTPGGICLKIENKIFTGDTLFKEGVGRTDFYHGDEKMLLDAIKKRLMIFEDNVEVYPGHGPSSTIGHERENNPFLSNDE